MNNKEDEERQMGVLALVTEARSRQACPVRMLAATTVGILALVSFAPPVAAAFPTATDFDLNPIPVDTVIVVVAADLVGSFATDPDGPLAATSLDFDGATIGGVPVGSPADAGFSYIPGAGTAGEFTVDPTVAAFAGLTLGDSVAVEVSYTVTDPDLDSDNGLLRYTVVGDLGPYDQLTFDHQGLPAAGVTATAVAGVGDALAAVVMTGPGTVESAVAGYDFAAITTPPFTPGAETAVAIAIDDSEATASAENGAVATASALAGSDATATAAAASNAVASADDLASATSFAQTSSVASADATAGSIATAVSVDSSAATATPSSGSDALAFAENASAAEASADEESSATATADSTSNATATALNESTAVASADDVSSATSSAQAISVASADATAGSIATAVSVDSSAATATPSSGSDALAFAENASAAEATASDESSASAAAENTSNATATALDDATATATANNESSATADADGGSVSNAVADNNRATSSQASGGSSIAVRSPAPVAFPEIDDDAPSSAALRLPEALVAPANTETPLPFEVSGSGGAIDRVVLDGFPEGTILSAGTEESPGVWAFAGPPPPDLSFLLPFRSTESFSLDVRINVASGLGFAEAPMLVTVTTEATAVPTVNGYALALLALALMLVTAMTMRGRSWT